MRISILLMVAFLTLTSCGDEQSSNTATAQSNVHEVVVKEVLHTTNYTYLFVTENNTENWLAVPRMDDAKAGETYYHDGGMLMKGFASKELNRTFEEVYFLGGVRETLEKPVVNMNNVHAHGTNKDETTQKEIKVENVEGAITIAELIENKDKYSGKKVTIRGEVTKFNEAIMNKNWIHLQDGSNFNGEFDLTVTSDVKANVGDVITIEGTVSLDKDFGYGYSYKILVEDAVVK